MRMLLVAILLTVSACNTSPVKVSMAKAVPESRISFLPKYDGKDAAHVVVVRDSGLLGGGGDIKLKFDGKEVARLSTSEKVEFTVSPGSHIIAAVAYAGEPVEVETNLKANEKANYRISTSGGSAFIVTIQKSAELD